MDAEPEFIGPDLEDLALSDNGHVSSKPDEAVLLSVIRG